MRRGGSISDAIGGAAGGAGCARIRAARAGLVLALLATDAGGRDVLASPAATPDDVAAAAATSDAGNADAGGGGDGSTPPGAQPFAGDVEIKRQNTDRASPEESTKTTLRVERYFAGALSLVRLDVPLADDKTDFGGSPFNPRLGDLKLRLGFGPMLAHETPVEAFVELTAPTGETPKFGSGKWQLTPGVETNLAVALPHPDEWTSSLHLLAQQDVAFAGDAAAHDINYTKFEIGAEAHGQDGRLLKLTLKPVIDWVQDGRSGAVLELEGGMRLSTAWFATLMLGRGLRNGGDVPSTYENRVELTIKYKY